MEFIWQGGKSIPWFSTWLKRINKPVIDQQVLTNQVFFSGVEAWAMVSLLTSLLAILLVFTIAPIFATIGRSEWLFEFLIIVFIRDFMPFIIGLILLARSGTAITTELGNMKVNKEIDALVVFGQDVMNYLIWPRVAALILATVILGIFAMAAGLFSAYLSSFFVSSINSDSFWFQLLSDLKLTDIITMLIKLLFTGLFIAAISSYFGLKVQRAVTQVPQQTIKAVGFNILAIILINSLTLLSYYG